MIVTFHMLQFCSVKTSESNIKNRIDRNVKCNCPPSRDLTLTLRKEIGKQMKKIFKDITGPVFSYSIMNTSDPNVVRIVDFKVRDFEIKAEDLHE